MIVQEPVQAAIWHCLNHYDYTNAVFLAERLYAEVKTDDSLFLLATSYYRSGLKKHVYHILKDRSSFSPQCKYLLGLCAYELEKYAEAEEILIPCNSNINSANLNANKALFDDIIFEFGEQAPFVLTLLGKIAAKTERKSRAVEAWKKSLKLNPFQWSTYEHLCKIGERPNPDSIFQVNNIEDLSMCQGTNINNVDSVIMTSSTPNSGVAQEPYVATPSQLFTCINLNLTNTVNGNANCNTKFCTPEESPLAQPLPLSGFAPFLQKTARPKHSMMGLLKLKGQLDYSDNCTPQPSFGYFAAAATTATTNHDSISGNRTPSFLAPYSAVFEPPQTIPSKRKPQIDQMITNRKEQAILQNLKPVFSQSTNVTKTTSIQPLTIQPQPTVRRSSRLFTSSNSYSVKENANKSPSRGRCLTTARSPSKKSRQRLTKCNNNNNSLNTKELLNTRNTAMMDRGSETIAMDVSEKKLTDDSSEHGTNNNNSAMVAAHQNYCLQKAIMMQRHSAEGLLALLRTLGEAYVELMQFNCRQAIEYFNNLPLNQLNTAWVQCHLGMAYFGIPDYESSCLYFEQVHNTEPHRIDFMDVYSTALWHLQREVTLSALAQYLVATEKNSPITWCVSGNCFSLHKEHDTAIKFFQRAVQVDPTFPYAYTLLGHEYITTEELDKAMSCFRNAIRLDPRHYNAWFGIGTIYSKQERYSLAELNYTRALSINPHSSVILCHIGVVQHSLKQTEKALNTFNMALSNNPNSPQCKFHRGSIYFALGRNAEALNELEELKQIVPKENLVYYLIGKIHKKMGNTDLALMHFSWATDLDPKGANSQIKEAFDPPIGGTVQNDSSDGSGNNNGMAADGTGSSMVTERPGFTTPSTEEGSSSFHLQHQVLNFNNVTDDSEDSF